MDYQLDIEHARTLAAKFESIEAYWYVERDRLPPANGQPPAEGA